MSSSAPLRGGHTLSALHSIHARTERYNCIFEFNSRDPTALRYSGTLFRQIKDLVRGLHIK